MSYGPEAFGGCEATFQATLQESSCLGGCSSSVPNEVSFVSLVAFTDADPYHTIGHVRGVQPEEERPSAEFA